MESSSIESEEMQERRVFHFSKEEIDKIRGMLPRGYSLITPLQLQQMQLQAKKGKKRSTSQREAKSTSKMKGKSNNDKSKHKQAKTKVEDSEQILEAMQVEYRLIAPLSLSQENREMEIEMKKPLPKALLGQQSMEIEIPPYLRQKVKEATQTEVDIRPEVRLFQQGQEQNVEEKQLTTLTQKKQSKRRTRRNRFAQETQATGLEEAQTAPLNTDESQPESGKARSRGKSRSKKKVFEPMTTMEKVSLGKNLKQLPSEQLEYICYRFCDPGDEEQFGKATFYKFDLLEMREATVRQLQIYVKKAFKQIDREYQELSSDEDADFVIEDDE